ncbi:MBL fold metallo-hydrolase [Arthrobacter sp. JZ12]|uniref:MBL fold metallo-hydrolase n=1 Tax=Arthrobacter sp. JZ12 TaxID=2654190 RepID=UPI002B48303A|nr:MBL fold metallo-hydrolase [Arthrobacter sp. JZ12]WRH25275.1 MBL fold metallo-hydrolase [Arthrobacter sp. JZ12]
MLLTKFTHACIRVEDGGSVITIDPGTFSEVEEAIAGAAAILITHEHPDHIDRDRVAAAVRSSDSLKVYAPEGVAQDLREAVGEGASSRVSTVEPERRYTIAGFDVRTFGGQHALIHPHIPVVKNIGYLVNGELYHPGDSFIVPHGVTVGTLLVPIHAPWSKTAEVIDFVTSVRAARAHQIHDALLNETGLRMVEGHVARLGGHYGTEFKHLSPRESVTI